ncbi:hypothetical protein CDD82_1736 [Ophiocordyceps australis]|uniref:Uncharacterized protein n=1 Tax=Ophiocordyceps australis TaxID=1399860 RepID=A0A2C5ZHD5_9HYPO|nr:hypothetical protein CDD82_1736 [Ophiocordyceps australis]
MATHRRKRVFAGQATDPSQRQITSFFAPADASGARAAAPSWPQVPDNVAAGLLSVGMRVRKSVPQGYRTMDTGGGFKLWADGETTTTTTTTQRLELLPFCGLNKIGGLAAQSGLEAEDGYALEMDAVPGLTLSQESITSTDSEARPPCRKRVLTLDDDADPGAVTRWVGGEVGPHTLVPGTGANARVVATPHGRLHKSTALDQENMALDHDFDEADFLVYGHGRDVEMSP